MIEMPGDGDVRIEDDWLRRMGPAHFGHINFRGTMRFGIERHGQSLLQDGDTAALGEKVS
jgi:hypothetical protein